MGLLNVIRLANDYNKAKKYLKKSNLDKDKLSKLLERVMKYKQVLQELSDSLGFMIKETKELIVKLKGAIK